jgi:hypothetical protein
MSSPAPAALAQYYIADGVHRAVAARENGLARVPAKLVIQGQPDPADLCEPGPIALAEHVDQPDRDGAARYTALEAAMATLAGRAMVPPIEVLPLGAPGQTASVPLAQVKIVN